MEHSIKIKQHFLIHILEGKKNFEIRKNDRDYQVGDTIQFLPLESDDYDVYQIASPIPRFIINYVLSDNGLQQNHVALAIAPIGA